jgi:alpha-tubulin suppressor-like RCC1 family protein
MDPIPLLSENSSIPLDIPAVDESSDAVPAIYSWGRSDNATLLTSIENKGVDGVFMYPNVSRRVILQISSGQYHTACIASSGDLIMCGSNEEGQLGTTEAALLTGSVQRNSSNESTPVSNTFLERASDQLVRKPRVVELGSQRITSVAVGLYHTVCVTASGVALGFGGNESGQSGHSREIKSHTKPSKVDFRIQSLGRALVVKQACR